MIRVGVDYYPEHWDKAWWEEDACEMERVGVNTVRLAEFSWGILEPREGEYDFVWLDEIISIFARHNIEVILGTPTNCAPLWMYNRYPETMQADRNGQRTTPGIRGHRCMTDPGFRQFAERIIQKMAERYVHDPRVIAWQIDNEPEGNHCCCASCAADFQKYVKEKYNSLESLNFTWGTDVWSGQYSAWEQITPPLGSENQYGWYNPSYLLEYERWASYSCEEYLRFQRDLIRRFRPDAVITTNACFQKNMPDFHNVFSEMDVASYDNYPEVRLPEDKETIYSQAFALDLVRGYKKQNFWILEQLSGPKGCWIPISPTTRPGMVEGYAWQTMARGADMVLFFRWRSAQKGAEMFWHGLIDNSVPSGRRYAEFTSFVRGVHALRELDGTRVVSKVAMLYSYEQDRAFRIQQQSEGFLYWEQMRLWHDGFLSLGVNVDIISAEAPLDGYDVVVATTQYITDTALVSRLEKYVAMGGSLVITNRSGVKDKTNGRLTEPLPNAFRALCGCVVREYDPIGNMEQSIKTEDGERYTVTRWCDILDLEGAKTYAYYADSFYAGSSAITVHEYGAGQCLYIGTVGQRSLYRRLACDLLSKAGIAYHDDLPQGIEISTRENDSYILSFAFNNTENTQQVRLEGEMCHLQPFEMRITKTANIQRS